MTEVWRPIPDFPHHEASSLGRIRRTTNGKGRAKPGLILHQKTRGNGYVIVSISGQKHFVHRLVCAAFHGDPMGREVSHESGDKSDNTAANLAWKTHQENEALKVIHGTKAIGSRCGAAILDEVQVIIVKSALRQKMASQKRIADFFGVSRATIGDIFNNKTWRHVE
jgi:hypothetical protein